MRTATSTTSPARAFVRIGIVCYGLVHLLVAWFAVRIAYGDRGERADQTGAFAAIAQQPFGRILLWVLVAGFAAVALWWAEQAVRGFRHVRERPARVRLRATSGGKAVVFAALAVLAGRTASGAGGGDAAGAAAGVLGLPGGQLLVGAVGVGIGVTGVVTAVNGMRRTFRHDLNLPPVPGMRAAVERIGVVGLVAKGAAVLLIGVFVVVAAIEYRPEEAAGLDVALRALAAQPFGPVLLVAVGLGLAAYGVFCGFDAHYRRV